MNFSHKFQDREGLFPHWVLDIRPYLPLLGCLLFMTEGLFKHDTLRQAGSFWHFQASLHAQESFCCSLMPQLVVRNLVRILRPVTWVRWQTWLSHSQCLDFLFTSYLGPAPMKPGVSHGVSAFSAPFNPSYPHSKESFLVLKYKKLFFDIIMQYIFLNHYAIF